jgi:type IV pilus assembly protein PilF
MLIRNFNKFTILLVLAQLCQACGLLPNFNSDSMSNDEKAILYMQMGTRYLAMDKLDIAKESLDKAMRLDSGNADIHNAMGSFYERIKEYDDAEKSYRTAVRKAPDNFNIKANFGRFLCERANYKPGMELLKEAVDQPMNNHQWFAYTGLGVCYYNQNDLINAETNFRQALLMKPDFAPALLEMQKISYQNHQYLSARAFLERYLSVAQHTPETLWIAFQTERSLDNTSSAEEYADLLFKNFPASKEAVEIKSTLGR